MTATSPQMAPRRAVDELEANGATFTYRPAQDPLPATFTHELVRNGDRQKCRRLIATVKAEPKVWAAVVAEVAAISAQDGGGQA